MTAHQSHARLAAIPALLALLATLPTLWGSFVFDDALLVESPGLRSFDLGRIFGSHYWGELRFDTNYRPFVLLSYALQFQISDSAFGFHLVNVALHICVAWCAHRVARHLMGDGSGALIAASLYAVFAIRLEAVAWVVGRAEILAALAVLGAWWLHLAGRDRSPAGLAALGGIAFLGVCAKENAALLPGVLLASAWARRARLPWRSIVVCTAAILIYMALRQIILAENFRIVEEGRALLVSRVDNPIHHDWVDAPTRITNALGLVGLYLWKTLVPLHLSADYSFDALPVLAPAESRLWLRILGLTAVFAAALIFFRRRRDAAGTCGVVFFPLAFAVSANVLFGIGTIFGERLAYLPSFGVALALAAAYVRTAPGSRSRKAVGLVLALILVGNLGRSFVRAWEWRDASSLYAATFESTPESVRAQILGATAAVEQAKESTDANERTRWLDLALERAQRATAILPDYARAHGSLASVHFERAQGGAALTEYAAAERSYTRAIDLMVATHQSEPALLDGRGQARLARVRRALARGQGAPRDLAPVLESAWSDFDVLIRAFEERGRPVDSSYRYRRAVAAAMLADFRPARRAQWVTAASADFDAVLAAVPQHTDALMQSGLLLARTGQLRAAIERLENGLEACRAAGRNFHPSGVSAWGFARELAALYERSGDAPAAARARALADELRAR